MDESGFSLNYPLTQCWMQSATQKRLPANTQVGRGCLLAGVMDWMSARVWCQPIAKRSTECLIRFFEGLLLEVYPTDKLVLVMDNAASPHAKTMQAFLSLFEQRVMGDHWAVEEIR